MDCRMYEFRASEVVKTIFELVRREKGKGRGRKRGEAEAGIDEKIEKAIKGAI